MNKGASTTYGREHCIVLHKGDQFKVQDESVVQGAARVRQTPAPDCYWTNAQMLKTP